MDEIGFLYYVSLGGSTAQLHDNLGRGPDGHCLGYTWIFFEITNLGNRRACTCSEAGFSSQNEDRAWGIYYRRTAFCCAILRAKGLNAKDIHKEMFPVYGGKCLSCKAVHNWVEERGKGLFCWWRRDWNRCRSGCYNSQKTSITCFTFYIHLWPIYWLSLVHCRVELPPL
jgi:hypothetical protein